MAGMKSRFTRIRNLASSKAKGGTYGILLFLMALAVPRYAITQDKPDLSTSKSQYDSATSSKELHVADISQGSIGTAEEALPPGAITDVQMAPDDDRVTVTVSTDRTLAPTEAILEDPPRLVLDFPNTANKVPFIRLPVHAASVKRIRIAQFQGMPSPIARMVFDLEEGYGAHQITVDESLVRVVFQGKSSKSNSEGARPALKSTPTQVEAIPKSVPDKAPQTLSVPAEMPKIIASELKAKPAEPPKPPAVKELPATGVPTPIAQAQSSNSSAASSDPKPRREEIESNKPPSNTPLVAALTPASIVAAPKPVMFPNSRFSGQPLTLDLIDMPLVDFFRLMADEGGINIVMDPEIKGRISIKVVKVPWDQIFEAALSNHSLDKQVEGTLVRIARKSTLQEEAKQQESLKKANLLAADLETSIKRLNYAKAETLVKALEDQKTVRGTVVVDERTNSLILTDIPSSINKLTKLIETLDIPQPQVEIEARIVSATRDFARDIGIQFGFVQGNLQRVTVGGPNTFGTIGGTRPSATPTSTYAAGNPFTGRGAADDQTSGSASVSTGTSTNNQGNFNVNLPAGKAFGGLGISVGNIFDTFLLDAAITAGESKGLAKLISQPKVTAQNNSSATITQGLRFPVQIIANNTISVQFQNAALTLVVTPQITYEGNIVLDLKVENNTPDFARQVNGIPSIRTSESTTRVLVSDGGTTVIGGILVDNEASSEDKIPGLGSLPIVGNLFRRTAVSRSTQEVLFFVTPRIIK
jgi:type IV pilus secretin PilQ/predicted competence protein